jgi:hypothetical protein
MWPAILVASALCYGLKLAGLSVPESILANERVQRMAAFMPVALLMALIATQTFSDAKELVLDARAAGLAVGVGALLLRAPFLVVVGAAAATAALVRAVS